MFVIFETNILIKASNVFFLFNNANTDLNSGQLVSVDKTINQIIHFGAFDASAVKLTIGSRKYHDINNIINQRGKYILLTDSSSLCHKSLWSNFLVNKYKVTTKDIITQYI